ncbi:hypothetical protein EVAR_81865_1 [Eumeta japonica]|uniref:Uncharacterized protein n=1 Tax=Eumeta variegata TaxID=151549 RepID=A0A4C1UY86_EUMVA|nr:hypothetical protein EVAR_81865_1 [Eumeta japonica]
MSSSARHFHVKPNLYHFIRRPRNVLIDPPDTLTPKVTSHSLALGARSTHYRVLRNTYSVFLSDVAKLACPPLPAVRDYPNSPYPSMM